VKGDKVRGIALKAILALAACALLIVTLGSGSGSKASSTLIFAGAADPTYLDPALASDGETFRVTEQMYEGLVALKPGTTKVIPKLAIKWKSANRGRTWTFWLRHGVKFHDGTPFNSAAVCANFNRWYTWSGAFQDPSATFYYQAIYGGFKHNEVSGLQPPLYRSCSAKGRYKAIVKLRKASGTFFPSLVIAPFAMHSPTALC
jgi:peptide/nickel transport system substrate-binding protein